MQGKHPHLGISPLITVLAIVVIIIAAAAIVSFSEMGRSSTTSVASTSSSSESRPVTTSTTQSTSSLTQSLTTFSSLVSNSSSSSTSTSTSSRVDTNSTFTVTQTSTTPTGIFTGLDGWTWNALAKPMNEYIPVGDTQTLGKVILFQNCLVYWHNPNSSFLAIGVYNLTTHTNADVWTWEGGQMLGSDFMIANSTLYFAFAGQGNYPIYNGSIIYTTNLKNWKTLLVSNTMTIESLAEYNGKLLYGGYQSQGAGTYSIIDTWNGSEVRLFTGTADGSDDVTFLAHFNTTMLVGGDAFPQSIIYTNDGVHWYKDYSSAGLSAPYIMGWSFNYEVRNDMLWMPSAGYSTSINERSGLATFDGRNYVSYPLPYSLFSIANGTVGGTLGIWNSTLQNFPGKGAIFVYNPNGTLGPQIMDSTVNGSVMSLSYSAPRNALYGLFFDSSAGLLYILEGDPS